MAEVEFGLGLRSSLVACIKGELVVEATVSRWQFPGDRVRRHVASAMSLALLPGMFVAAPVFAQSGATAGAPVTQSEADGCADQAGTVEAATEMAQACGTDVVVAESLTEWETATVDSETGDLAVDTSMSAVRQDSDGDGAWAPVDVLISGDPVAGANADGAPAGMLQVSGGVEPIWLNPGGASGADLPLAIIGSADQRVSMSSASLPVTAPLTIEGSRATYDFGDGVSLIATVNAEGTAVTPVIRVADQVALEHLRDDLLTGAGDSSEPLALSFPLAMTEGLSAEVAGLGFEIRDATGEVRFESGPALMWDSAGGDVDWDGVGAATALASFGAAAEAADGDRLDSPASGDNVAAMEVQVSSDAGGTEVTVVADEGMLSDPALTFPLHLDPRIGAPTPARWAMVQSTWPTTATFNYDGNEGLGYCDPAWDYERCRGVSNVQRLLFEFFSLNNGSTYLADLDGSDIEKAVFSVEGTHSWDCSVRQVNAYATGRISSSTTWNNQPPWNTVQSTWSGTHRAGCSSGIAEFDLTTRARVQANANESWIAIGLRAANESSMSWWKRYVGSSGTLSIVYDRPPLAPTTSSMKIRTADQTYGCVTGPGRPRLTTEAPALEAMGREPDGTNAVSLRFRVQNLDGVTVWVSDWTTPGGAAAQQRRIPGDAGLRNATHYEWHVKVRSTDPTTDTTRYTSWEDSPQCQFTVDTVNPPGPKVSSPEFPVRRINGGVGDTGHFTFSPNGATDVVKFWWSYNNQNVLREKPVSAGESADVAVVSMARSGLNYVAVQAQDISGRRSQVVIYEFYVGFAHKTAHWQFNDSGWATTSPLIAANSLAGSGVGSLTRSAGVTWTQGPPPDGLYPPSGVPGTDPASRVPDGAWKFDAVGDVARANGPAVAADATYTIGAFLRVDELTGSAAAVSQEADPAATIDGDYRSGLHLGYSSSPDCTTYPKPCWAFWQVMDNEPDSSNVIARTDVPVQAGKWAYVMAVHDANAKTIQVWACSIGSSERPVASGPVDLVDDQGDRVVPWNTTGPLRLGSGDKNGNPVWRFTGAIDEVRVYDGAIVEPDVMWDICVGRDVP